MKLLKTKGLILKEIHVGEADKILTVLTKEYGKISISAKGARKSKSQFLAAAQLFAYCDFIIYEGNNMYILNQAEIINTFHSIRNDLFKLSYGVYMLELLETVSEENTPSESGLELAVKTLHVLSITELNPKLITRIFEIRLLQIAGYMPETQKCVHCGKPAEGNSHFFSPNLGGILCADCHAEDPKAGKVSKGTVYTIQYILFSDIKKLFAFTVSEEVLQEISKVTKVFIAVHIEKEFKTLAFLEQL